VHLYLGVSQFFVNKKSAAIESLRRAVDLNQQLVAAQWYLAQAHLSQGRLEDANKLLFALAGQDDSQYAQLAQGLLEKLKKLGKEN
jgi:predicted Zn-dependent protease